MVRTICVVLTVVVLAACDDGVAPSGNVEGTYVATDFRVSPPGGQEIDVLAAGGELSISIDADDETTGTLLLPASVTGGATLTESMAGTAVVSGNTVTFDQPADTFVRDLTWLRSGATLVVVNQLIAGAAWNITLTRQ